MKQSPEKTRVSQFAIWSPSRIEGPLYIVISSKKWPTTSMSHSLRFSIQTDLSEDSKRTQVCSRKLFRLPVQPREPGDEVDVPEVFVPVEFTQEELDQMTQIAEVEGKSIDDCIADALEDFLEDLYFNRVADERLREFEDDPAPLTTLEELVALYGLDRV